MADFQLPPGLNGYRAAMQDGILRQHNDAQQATAGIGIIQLIQKQQQDQQLRGILASDIPMEQKQKALMSIPGGIDILGKLATQANAGVTADLHRAQLGEINRKGVITQGEQKAKGALANLVAGGGYQANNPTEMAPTQVMQDPAAAERAAIEQYRKDPNTPFAIDVPNPANVKGLAIAAGSALPRGTASDLLKSSQSAGTGKIADTVRAVTGGYIERQSDGTTKFIATGGGIEPDSPERQKSVDFWADVVRKGGALPPGLARNKDGAALVKDVMRAVSGKDTAPEDIMANQAEFMGEKAGQRTLGTRTANIEMAVREAQNVIPIALAASEKVDRTNFPSLNSVLLAAEKGTGDQNVVRFATATNALINVYARAISPSGTPTVSDKDHAREILATAYSKGQYAAAVDTMKQEMTAAQKSPGQVRNSMREQFTGKPVPTSAVTTPSASVREFATEADAVASGVKGAVKIGGRNARID